MLVIPIIHSLNRLATQTYQYKYHTMARGERIGHANKVLRYETICGFGLDKERNCSDP